LGEIFCGEKSGSGFCPVMGGVERPGNEWQLRVLRSQRQVHKNREGRAQIPSAVR
jgi:hypothetical protein